MFGSAVENDAQRDAVDWISTKSSYLVTYSKLGILSVFNFVSGHSVEQSHVANLSGTSFLVSSGASLILCVLDAVGEIWSLQFDDDLANSSSVNVICHADSLRAKLAKASHIFSTLDIAAWKRNQKLVKMCTDSVLEVRRDCAQKRKRIEAALTLSAHSRSSTTDNSDFVKPEDRKRQKQEEGLKRFYKKSAKLEQLRKQGIISKLQNNPMSVDEFAAISKFSDVSELVSFFAMTPIQQPPKLKARLELLDDKRRQKIKEREEQIRNWKQSRLSVVSPVEPHRGSPSEVGSRTDTVPSTGKSHLQVLRGVLQKRGLTLQPVLETSLAVSAAAVSKDSAAAFELTRVLNAILFAVTFVSNDGMLSSAQNSLLSLYYEASEPVVAGEQVHSQNIDSAKRLPQASESALDVSVTSPVPKVFVTIERVLQQINSEGALRRFVEAGIDDSVLDQLDHDVLRTLSLIREDEIDSFLCALKNGDSGNLVREYVEAPPGVKVAAAGIAATMPSELQEPAASSSSTLVAATAGDSAVDGAKTATEAQQPADDIATASAPVKRGVSNAAKKGFGALLRASKSG
jgi:hypothetical protein